MVNKRVIDTVLTRVINKAYVDKCGRDATTEASGLIFSDDNPYDNTPTDVPDKSVLESVANEMCEKYGLEVSVDSNGKQEISKTKFRLWDEEHHTLIHLSKMLKHQNWIDFTNSGNGNYNLDDVLSYYNDLDDLAKNRMGGLIFENNNGASYNRVYNGAYKIANTVEISNMVYGLLNNAKGSSEFHMKRVINHEAGHAMERLLTKEQVSVLDKTCIGKNKFSPKGLDKNELKVFKSLMASGDGGRADAVSSSQEYFEAMQSNNVTFASAYSSYTFNKGSLLMSEDFAETMSAVEYRNSNDKSTFRIRYSDGRMADWDTFVRDHKATYDLCCDYVDGKLSPSDLHDYVNPFA